MEWPRNIHYGCGGNLLEGWLNVDNFQAHYQWGSVSEAVKDKIVDLDLAGPQPFPDGYFQYGFAEDFLEHLDQAGSIVFLAECYRTFARGGVLRLSFPGLPGVLRWHFRESSYGGARAGCRLAYEMWNHKHFYCRESLELVIRHLGFTGFKEVEYGRSEHECLNGLDTRHRQMRLNLRVEVIK